MLQNSPIDAARACYALYQQTQRWLKAGVFEDMVRDLRMLMREINERHNRL